MITLADFQKLEIKIGKVLAVEKIPEADKLLKLIFDLGSEKRQVLAGIAEFFPDLSVLIGKSMPLLVNIEPRKFRGYESQGMIIAVDVNGRPVFLLPEEEVPPGSPIK